MEEKRTEEMEVKELSVEEIKKMNIHEKISAITNEIGLVIKSLEVKEDESSSYKAVRERDILDAVKPIENKYRVSSYPISRKVVDREMLIRNNDKKRAIFIRIETMYRFTNVDKPEEYVDTISYGDGIDAADKAPGIAMTYADKYALMKVYKISTGDDLEEKPTPKGGYDKSGEGAVTKNQLDIINKLSDANKSKALEKYNVSKLEDLTMNQAEEIIKMLTKSGKK